MNTRGSSKKLIVDLENIIGTSWNRNHTLRSRLRKEDSPEILVNAYNHLINTIRRNSNVSGKDKDFIKALQQECMEEWWKFYGSISEEKDEKTIVHQYGISRYSEQIGRIELVSGFTKLATWRLISPSRMKT